MTSIAAAPALAAYTEGRARQTEVVALRAPRSGPLEGVTTVTRRDTGADIGTVRRSATGTAWFATMPNGGGLGGTYTARQIAVGALIDHAVLSEVDQQPAARLAVGDHVRDLPADRTGRVVGVSYATGEGYAVRVVWDGGDGVARQYSEDYLEKLCACGEDAAHLAADEDSSEWACRVPNAAAALERIAADLDGADLTELAERTAADVAGGDPITRVHDLIPPADVERLRAARATRATADHVRRELAKRAVNAAERDLEPAADEAAGPWAVEDEPWEEAKGGGLLWHLTHNGNATSLSYGSRVRAVEAMLERNAYVRTQAEGEATSQQRRDRRVADDEQVEPGTPVRVIAYGYGARKLDVGRWGAVVSHVAGQRLAVELEPSGDRPREVRRLHPDEVVVELPTTEAPDIEPACECVFSCADDPVTACSLSGQFHVHAELGACPVHPNAPGDRIAKRAVDAAATSNAAQELERRRKGHPGPARRTTSVRFTDDEYARIDQAIGEGYGDGLNAVLARLVREQLALAVGNDALRARLGELEGGAR